MWGTYLPTNSTYLIIIYNWCLLIKFQCSSKIPPRQLIKFQKHFILDFTHFTLPDFSVKASRPCPHPLKASNNTKYKDEVVNPIRIRNKALLHIFCIQLNWISHTRPSVCYGNFTGTRGILPTFTPLLLNYCFRLGWVCECAIVLVLTTGGELFILDLDSIYSDRQIISYFGLFEFMMKW